MQSQLHHLHISDNFFSLNTYLCMRISFKESRTLRLIASTDTGFFEAEDGDLLFVSCFS